MRIDLFGPTGKLLLAREGSRCAAASARLRFDSDDTLRHRVDDLRSDFEREWCASRSVWSMFALVQEAVRRCLNLILRPNQLETAWHLLQRRIVELPTGEGKTLAATPALAVRALAGRGVWLATANDYLARRDAMAIRPVFALLGLTTGFVQSSDSPANRRLAYDCDITYGTIREFGFDFLRDRLKQRRSGSGSMDRGSCLQREAFSLIVDEADSVLLDDARTPLIISEPNAVGRDSQLSQWCVQTGRTLQSDVDYLADPHSQRVWITESGRAKVRAAANRRILVQMTLPEAYESVAQAIRAGQMFQKNRDYVVRDGEIVIIDQSTGRLAVGRQWQDGIQQMLEAGNEIEITPQTRSVAKVTVQRFLQEFQYLSGMTGTAREAAGEFSRLYRLKTVVSHPFRPCRRIELPSQVLRGASEKWSAVVSAVRHCGESGRPILIGTRELGASEELSRRLESFGIAHQVLTANQEAEEARLIAQAGRRGMITVSTNIAGRGTDIQLESGVAELGGLHVIAADLFDASRIDRQLAGRAGRQGVPASYQKILSLEDGILQAAGDPTGLWTEGGTSIAKLSHAGLASKLRLLRSAQQSLERRHAKARLALLQADQMRVKRQTPLGFSPFLDEIES